MGLSGRLLRQRPCLSARAIRCRTRFPVNFHFLPPTPRLGVDARGVPTHSASCPPCPRLDILALIPVGGDHVAVLDKPLSHVAAVAGDRADHPAVPVVVVDDHVHVLADPRMQQPDRAGWPVKPQHCGHRDRTGWMDTQKDPERPEPRDPSNRNRPGRGRCPDPQRAVATAWPRRGLAPRRNPCGARRPSCLGLGGLRGRQALVTYPR